jgi:hypothetical protein
MSASVPVAKVETPTASSTTVETSTPVTPSKMAPIPSMVSMTQEDKEALAVFAQSKKKYNITALPEALCDGCQ